MKLVILLFVVLMFGFFCSAALGDDWDSFEGDDESGSSSVGVDVGVGVSDDMAGGVGLNVGSGGNGGATKYTLEFYIALVVGAFGVLITVIFVYFFLKKPKNKWEKRKAIK